MLYQPTHLDEALRLKAQLGGQIEALAGGTDLIVAMTRGQWHPKNILDLTRIAGGSAIRRKNGSYEILHGVTYTQLMRLPVKVLAQAASSIGGPQIRNRGTLAGNLGTASPAGDGSVALLALDAKLELTHADRGARTLPVRDYFLGYKHTELKPDELITRMTVPGDWTTAWYKIGKRSSVNISVACAAVGRSPEGRYCVAFGAVGPYPLHAPKTEALLNGNELTHELIAAAAAAAKSEVAPITDHRASAAYRRAMCAVLLRRLLTEHFLAPKR